MATATKAAPTQVATTTLHAALVQAQRLARAVGKSSRNPHHGYDYASADAMAAEGRKALNEAGLALMEIGSVIRAGTPDAPDVLVSTYVLVHEESGDVRELVREMPIVPDKGRPDDKAASTASTYSLGYTIRGLLCLDRGDVAADDVDARDDSAHVPKPRGTGARDGRIKNKHAGECVKGDGVVQPGEGWARKDDESGKWRTIHDACLTAPAGDRTPGEDD